MSQPNPSPQEFEATILADERGRIHIKIPFDPKEAWGKSARYYVDFQIVGKAFSTLLGNRSGVYFFPFNREMQAQTGLGVGDKAPMSIFLAAAEERNTPQLPRDFEAQLNQDEKARDFWNSLSGFYKGAWLKWIESARQPETRNKRVRETIIALSQEKKQK